MDTQTLKKGIAILYDMELNNYMMTKTISDLYHRANRLGKASHFEEPQKRKSTYQFGNEWIGSLASVGALLGILLGGVAGCASSNHLLDSIGATLGGLISGGITGAIIGGIIGLVVAGIINARDDEKDEQEYLRKYNIYSRNVKNDQLRVEAELRKKKIILQERERLIVKRNQSKSILTDFYTIMEIDKDFRSLISMAYMNHALRLNICKKLEGIDGLYNWVEEKVQWNILQSTLEDISQKLDTIIDNQSKIYSEISNMNDKSGQLLNAVQETAKIASQNTEMLESINQNAQISAYNSERIAQEEEYQRFLMSINHK